jgi:hypothetical protein
MFRDMENSDQRVSKELTFYDDFHNSFEARVIKNLGLKHLERKRKRWRYPRNVNIKYSTISEKRKRYLQNRNRKNSRRNIKPGNLKSYPKNKRYNRRGA